MFHLLGIITFIFLFALIIGVAGVFFIIRRIVNFGRKMSGKGYASEGRTETSREYSSHSDSVAGDRVSKKKIFDSDEGNYVDFEEIKD